MKTENKNSPPGLAIRLLESICPRGMLETALGDLEEIFLKTKNEHGKKAARQRFWRETLLFCFWHWRKRRKERTDQARGSIMFKNNFKVVMRTMKKAPGYSAMNIAGLALGMACFLLILLFVQDELRFDDFHQKGDRIYRVNKSVLRESGDVEHTAEMPGNFGPTLVADYPEVESAVRFRPWWGSVLVTRDEKSLQIENVVFTDSTFFKVFDFELVEGDPNRVLAAPLSAVISEEVARQFFGAENPIGQMLEGLFDMPLKITGIARKPPENSHLAIHR